MPPELTANDTPVPEHRIGINKEGTIVGRDAPMPSAVSHFFTATLKHPVVRLVGKHDGCIVASRTKAVEAGQFDR